MRKLSLRSEATSKDDTNGERSRESLQLLCLSAHLPLLGQMAGWVGGTQDDNHTKQCGHPRQPVAQGS